MKKPSSNSVRSRVVIVQPCIMPYRVPFFERLDRTLADQGIDLLVVAGAPLAGSEQYDVRHELSCCQAVENIYSRFAVSPIWQRGILRKVRRCDLVIAPQVSSFLPNYFWMMNPWQSFAWWGHGKKFHKNGRERVRSWWKRRISARSDWWFAYNDLAKKIVADNGVDEEKITSVQNSTDTLQLRKECEAERPFKERHFEQLFGECYTFQKVAIYCARLVKSKQIGLLLESILQVHEEIPEFRMVIIGDGPERNRVQKFCAQHEWCKWVGAVVGPGRSRYFSVADVWLNPGLTGLQVNDSFGAGIPLLTITSPSHGPEISYIEPGSNGVIIDDGADSFAKEIVSLLKDSARLEHLKQKAFESADRYNVENMVERFTQGIVSCLAAKSIR